MDIALATGEFSSEFRINTTEGHRNISSKGVVNYKNGKPAGIAGTVMDVTQKQTLIQNLLKTEALYKQAEQIADMGNWSWDFATSRLEWTDQLYRIYGLEPQSEAITIEKFLSFVHTDDRDFVAKGVNKLNAEDTLDYTFRIITADGNEKWLRSIAQVLRNAEGKVTAIVGTEQNVTEKQRLIGKLEESQRLYKQAQELARIGNFLWELGTGDVFWSDEVYRIYEKPVGTKINFADSFAPIIDEHKALVQSAIEETIGGKKGRSVSYAIRKNNGELTYVNLHTDVRLANDGTVTAIIGTAQDVTEKETLINRLQESQNFIRKITDATPSIIASYNVRSGRYTFISEGLEKLLGYKTMEVKERGAGFFDEIIHPDDAPALYEKYAKTIAEVNSGSSSKEVVMEFTYRMKHKNGEYRWFHTYGTVFDFNAEGSVEHVLNITLDVTEQTQAVETIQEQEHFIQQIADASPTILYMFDVASQSIAYINREAYFVLGYLPEEITEEGSAITALLYHPDDLPLLPARSQSKKNFQQVDSMIQYECRMQHKDGEYRWLLVREIVFKADDKGAVTQIIGAALDITRRKEMERTILQNTHQLEQSNASLEEFAYVASHDLKEPLRKISTFGDRLAASHSEKLSADGTIYLTKIIDASQRMQSMISDLLSISMISGNQQFQKQSLQKILEETLLTLEFKIEQQNAIIRYDTLPEAHVVSSQFRQLFQNLLANSLKFVRDGVQPVVVITATHATTHEVDVYQLRQSPAYLKLVFSDNGIGFESEYAQKIFAIFHRLHGRSEYEGSGIGLAICRKIVEHHGGVIYAEGHPQAGAVFTVIIPA
jgi:PAS domain S-box-containing protein